MLAGSLIPRLSVGESLGTRLVSVGESLGTRLVSVGESLGTRLVSVGESLGMRLAGQPLIHWTSFIPRCTVCMGMRLTGDSGTT